MKKRGGVAVYIKDSIKCSIITGIKSKPNTETLWVDIKDGKDSLVLGVIYRPQNLEKTKRKKYLGRN